MSLNQLKKDLRHEALARRALISQDEVEKTGLIFAKAGLPVMPDRADGVISGFYPYQNELSLLPLFERLAAAGRPTALPVVEAKSRPLIFRLWRPGQALITGLWDIPIPPEEADTIEPDLLLVPLLAFDRHGYRLGYGGGFYDRTLEQLRHKKRITAIGIAFAVQQVDHVPHDGYDQRLDYVWTEQEVIRCG